MVTPSDLVDRAEALVSDRWHQRIVQRLAESRERELREGIPLAPPSTDDAIRALLKDLGTETQAGAEALERAASELSKCAKAYQARLTYEAHLRLQKTADGLLGKQT